MNDSTNGYPESLIPTGEPAGTVITGRIIGYSEAPSKFGGDVPIATLEGVSITRPGKGTEELEADRSLWLSSTVLLNQFAELEPEVGEMVRVAYLGKKVDADPAYHNFKVSCPERPPYKPNWAAIRGHDQDDAEAQYADAEP